MNIKILLQLIFEIFTHRAILRFNPSENFVSDEVSHLVVEALMLGGISKLFSGLVVTMIILNNFTDGILFDVFGQKPFFSN